MILSKLNFFVSWTLINFEKGLDNDAMICQITVYIYSQNILMPSLQLMHYLGNWPKMEYIIFIEIGL